MTSRRQRAMRLGLGIAELGRESQRGKPHRRRVQMSSMTDPAVESRCVTGKVRERGLGLQIRERAIAMCLTPVSDTRDRRSHRPVTEIQHWRRQGDDGD